MAHEHLVLSERCYTELQLRKEGYSKREQGMTETLMLAISTILCVVMVVYSVWIYWKYYCSPYRKRDAKPIGASTLTLLFIVNTILGLCMLVGLLTIY